MRKSILAAAGLAVVLAAPSLADQGFYLKGGVGYGAIEDTDVRVNNIDTYVDPEGDLRFNLGAGFGAPNGFRIELEASHREADSGAMGDLDGNDSSMNNNALMLNGLFDFNHDGKYQPYIGAGIGWARTKVSATIDEADWGLGVGTSYVQDEADGMAYQALLGLGVALTQRMTADFGYRAFWNAEAIGLPFDSEVDKWLSHEVAFGLRYSFGPVAEAAPPPAPPAPPVAPAAPAAPVTSCDDVPFVVYFEWDRAFLTDQAKDVVADAADRASTCDITRVVIEGHTDTSGAASYNVGLSERRARVVRDELIRLGIPASLISMEAKGETAPAVATPDGTREPLNRRSEVVIRVQG